MVRSFFSIASLALAVIPPALPADRCVLRSRFLSQHPAPRLRLLLPHSLPVLHLLPRPRVTRSRRRASCRRRAIASARAMQGTTRAVLAHASQVSHLSASPHDTRLTSSAGARPRRLSTRSSKAATDAASRCVLAATCIACAARQRASPPAPPSCPMYVHARVLASG